ncbi:MAG: phosphotransferase family protein, partial [Mycoplasma sp.]
NKDYIYFNKKNGDYIGRWIDGNNNPKWTSDLINVISNEVKKIHQLDLSIDEFNNFQYWKIFEKSKYFNKYKDIYIDLIKKYSDLEKIVCHCDLNPWNILINENNELILIDFERVKMNTKYWDFANLARETMSIEQIKYLCSVNNLDLEIFYDHLLITNIHALQWTLTLEDQTLVSTYRKNLLTKLNVLFDKEHLFKN